MIFVTVGTHEQQFNRLVKAIDDLVLCGKITKEVFIQTGYSTYEPKKCNYSQFVSYKEMKDLIKAADVIITHGGPSSFVEVLAEGKIPVVVPRSEAFDEHVNNHQVEFVSQVANRQGGIIPVYDTDDLYSAIEKSKNGSAGGYFESNNEMFCKNLSLLISGL